MPKWLVDLDWARASGWTAFVIGMGVFIWRGSHIVLEHHPETFQDVVHPIIFFEVLAQLGLVILVIGGLYLGVKKRRGDSVTGTFKRGLGLDDDEPPGGKAA